MASVLAGVSSQLLRWNPFNHMTMNIGKVTIAALESVREFFVIKAE
jgi:hypothetical protein